MNDVSKSMEHNLKEIKSEDKKPVPAEIEGGGYNWWYVCGECHCYISPRQERCEVCGNFISWDN